MNLQEQISPEVFEDIINDFIVGENNLFINYVVVHDVKIQPDDNYEHYVLNVTVYVKEGYIIGERFKDFTVSIMWNSFIDRLSRDKVFKKYLGLPLDKNKKDFFVSLEGEIKEGYPKKEKITETRDLIKRILKEEELSTKFRRRIKIGKAEELIRTLKSIYFKKDKPTDESIDALINRVIEEVLDEVYWYGGINDGELSDQEYNDLINYLQNYLSKTYKDELTKYYEKRQIDADKEKDDNITYVFKKHDKGYYDLTSSGFAESFSSFDKLLTKYGSWLDIDWDEVKQKLDNMNDYSDKNWNGNFTRPLRISTAKEPGNNWGYNFSIVKKKPREY
jgi:hypothetical protein